MAFTGHRTYRGETGDALSRTLEELCARGFRTFLSGMAVGFDLAAAEAVLALRERCPEAGAAHGRARMTRSGRLHRKDAVCPGRPWGRDVWSLRGAERGTPGEAERVEPAGTRLPEGDRSASLRKAG